MPGRERVMKARREREPAYVWNEFESNNMASWVPSGSVDGCLASGFCI
jgi:hypothetical protein